MPHIDEAYRLAHWLTGNRTDAEDVVQDASLRAFRAIREFAGGNPRSWLLSIVRNTAYSWLRKNRPTTVFTVEDLEAVELEQAKPGDPERRNPGSGTDRKSRCRAASRRYCGIAVAIPRDARAAGHRRPRLSGDRRGDRSADRNRDVAARARPSTADHDAQQRSMILARLARCHSRMAPRCAIS